MVFGPWRRQFKERQHFDEDLRPDQLDMYRVTALLDTSEHHVFQLAFRDWNGRKPADDEIEPVFVRYMFKQEIPPWVRQYNRKVLNLDRAGQLNPVELGVFKRLPSRRMRLIGQTYTIVLLVFMGMVTYMAFHPNPAPEDQPPIRQFNNAMP